MESASVSSASAPAVVPAAIKIKLPRKKVIKSAVVPVEPIDEIPPEEPVKTDLEIKVIEIKKKIILTNEQVIILEKQKKELERQKEYDDWKHNEEIFKSDFRNYWNEQETKLRECARNWNINPALVVSDSSELFDMNDDEICKKIFDALYPVKIINIVKNKKIVEVGTTNGKRNRKETKLHMINNMGTARKRIHELTKQYGNYQWGIYQGGRTGDGKKTIVAFSNGKYIMPSWKEIAVIAPFSENPFKTKSDFMEWIKKDIYNNRVAESN
jgi:hypothetical protein